MKTDTLESFRLGYWSAITLACVGVGYVLVLAVGILMARVLRRRSAEEEHKSL